MESRSPGSPPVCWRVIGSFIVSLGVISFSPPARAFDRIPRSLPELAQGSQLIFIGRCQAVSCHWNADHSLILTANRFRVVRAIKGAPGPSVTLDELGGSVGEDTLRVSSGAPRYTVGEEVLLCASHTELGRWVTSGAGQGRFEIVRDAHGRPWVQSDLYPRELEAMAPELRAKGRAPLDIFVGHVQALATSREVRP